jgi:hypothetical protein
MAQGSQTELSSVISFDRIDGEYYLPEYISNHRALSRIKTVSLPFFFLVSDGNHLSVSRHFSESGDVPYYRGQDVNDFFLENSNPIRIPRKIYETPAMRRSQFVSGDVLLSIVGTIGSLKHHVSKEKAEFIQECDAIAGVLNQFVVRLRKNKVHLLQEKTLEMYRLLSSRSGLIKDITIDDKTYEVRITTEDFIRRVESKTIVDLIEYKYPDQYQKIKLELKR